jgi:hypothetical protein
MEKLKRVPPFTIQNINWYIEELYEVESFNRDLMRWLIWYNTKKTTQDP